MADGQCLFLPITDFINEIVGTGPPGTHKYIKPPHTVISGTEGIIANKVAVRFAVGTV